MEVELVFFSGQAGILADGGAGPESRPPAQDGP